MARNLEPGDIGQLKSVVNSVVSLERQLPYTVECDCGGKVTTHGLEPVYCDKCGAQHTFRSEKPDLG
jgi:hypothetical protein